MARKSHMQSLLLKGATEHQYLHQVSTTVGIPAHLWDHTHSDVYAIIITLGAAAPVVSWVVCKLAVLKNVLSLRRDCWEKLIGFVSCLSAQWWHNGQYYEFQKKRSIFFLRNKDFCSDIHYETHLELKCLKPNIDLGVLWLKGAIIVLLETLPCPPASEYWRAMVTIA